MAAVIAGVGATPYARRPPRGSTTLSLTGRAAALALADAGVPPSEVDGLAISSFTLAPDHAVDVAWRLGMSVRWLMDDANGGVSGLNMLSHAVRAIEAGDASTVLVVAGDRFEPGSFRRLVDDFNSATRDTLAPLDYGGPNGLFAMLTQRHMRAHGLRRRDYGRLVVAQREWAGLNPDAVYRSPLTLDAYLSARPVAGPLGLYDCPPVVSGANAVVVTDGRALGRQRAQVAVRALMTSFNADRQAGDGLRTGLGELRDELWERAGRDPGDVDVASVYDDYPAMVLVQLADLGLVPEDDVARFLRTSVGGPGDRLPLNTSGGQLSAGQAGTGGALHGLVEVVRQLQGRAGERQVPAARTGLVTGYGMAVYRYGAGAAAAILEAAR